jgi:hypothetical protein
MTTAAAPQLIHLALDEAQRDTILAALRTYQRAGYGDPFNRPDYIQAIATPDDDSTSLDDEGIDDLCEQINIPPNAPIPPGTREAALASALRDLIADVRTIEGYWTEGTDDLIRVAEQALGEPSQELGTYWNHKGRYQKACEALQILIPAEGTVPNPGQNPALESLRLATNCYHDLYNNGLCNRRELFGDIFGFVPDHEDDFGGVDLTREFIGATERMMDRFVRTAATEQGISLV